MVTSMRRNDPEIAKIGIWIELPPRAEFVGEGIFQLVRFVIEGARRTQTQYVFFAPFWSYRGINSYLDEFDPALRQNLSVEYARKRPPFAWHFSGLGDRQPRRRLPWRRLRIWRAARRLFRYIVTLPTPVVALLALPVVPLAILLAPFVVVALAAWWLGRRWSNRILPKIKRRAKAFRLHLAGAAYHLLSEDEYERMIRKANRRRDIDCWLVPNPA